LRLIRIGAVCAAFALVACGRRAPENPRQWLNLAAEHFNGDGYAVNFQMRYTLAENGEQVFTQHKGEITGLDPRHFEIQLRSQMRVVQLSDKPIKVDTHLVADGEYIWTQSTYPGLAQPIVLKLLIDQADSMARVDPVLGNQISPRDLDPLLLWRLAAEFCTFTEGAVMTPGFVILIGQATPAFHQAAAHRSSLFQPQVLRLSLERATGKPVAMELLAASNKTTLETSFSVWQKLELEASDFVYQVPEGIEVVDRSGL
jgi:hypothetical protein